MSVSLRTINVENMHCHRVKEAKTKVDALVAKVDSYARQIEIEQEVLQSSYLGNLPTYWPLAPRASMFHRADTQFIEIKCLKKQAVNLIQFIKSIKAELIECLRDEDVFSREEVDLINEHKQKMDLINNLLEKAEKLNDSEIEKVINLFGSFRWSLQRFAFDEPFERGEGRLEETLTRVREIKTFCQIDTNQLIEKSKSLNDYFHELYVLSKDLSNLEFTPQSRRFLHIDILMNLSLIDELWVNLKSIPAIREESIKSALENGAVSDEVERVFEEYLNEKRKFCVLVHDVADQIIKIHDLGTKIIDAI